MAVTWLRHLAARASIPVYPLVGASGREKLRRLFVHRRLRVVHSPRHARLLAAVGHFPETLHAAARRVHDQIPEPRGVLVWGDDGGLFDAAARCRDEAELVAQASRIYADLLAGGPGASPSFGPQENPVAWRGVGPYGQGGKGMMGGTPYGRKMAMTGEDLRDGLQLDRSSLTLGPFLPWLPTGTTLALELQGEVVQSVRPDCLVRAADELDPAFGQAKHRPTEVATLERARARHHLQSTAELCRLHHLDAAADELSGLAERLAPDRADEVRRLAKRLRRPLGAATRAVGILLENLPAGPVARAAGREVDARLHDPAYAGLGFHPTTTEGGDAEARWRQRLDEAAQSLELASRARDRLREPGPEVEGPRGPLTAEGVWIDAIREATVGGTLATLATTLVSLDPPPSGLRREDDE